MPWIRVAMLNGGDIEVDLEVNRADGADGAPVSGVVVSGVRWRNRTSIDAALEVWKNGVRRLVRKIPAFSQGQRDLTLDLSAAQRTDISFCLRSR